MNVSSGAKNVFLTSGRHQANRSARLLGFALLATAILLAGSSFSPVAAHRVNDRDRIQVVVLAYETGFVQPGEGE